MPIREEGGQERGDLGESLAIFGELPLADQEAAGAGGRHGEGFGVLPSLVAVIVPASLSGLHREEPRRRPIPHVRRDLGAAVLAFPEAEYAVLRDRRIALRAARIVPRTVRVLARDQVASDHVELAAAGVGVEIGERETDARGFIHVVPAVSLGDVPAARDPAAKLCNQSGQGGIRRRNLGFDHRECRDRTLTDLLIPGLPLEKPEGALNNRIIVSPDDGRARGNGQDREHE